MASPRVRNNLPTFPMPDGSRGFLNPTEGQMYREIRVQFQFPPNGPPGRRVETAYTKCSSHEYMKDKGVSISHLVMDEFRLNISVPFFQVLDSIDRARICETPIGGAHFFHRRLDRREILEARLGIVMRWAGLLYYETTASAMTETHMGQIAEWIFFQNYHSFFYSNGRPWIVAMLREAGVFGAREHKMYPSWGVDNHNLDWFGLPRPELGVPVRGVALREKVCEFHQILWGPFSSWYPDIKSTLDPRDFMGVCTF